jgi:Kef-type K+ transport system membrane component KefB
MRKVALFSILLVAGLGFSQVLAGAGELVIRLLTMFFLSFIMIHVGYEFEIDKTRPRQYVWDYVVAGTAAAFPWIFCTLYFFFVMTPSDGWNFQRWIETTLVARFSSPTSAGVLFAMLAAAGLSATWVFKKARVLAIFDDLDTILLMIPLKALIIGLKWQLMAVIVLISVLLMAAWRWLHVVRLPVSWPFVMLYSLLITAVCEGIHVAGTMIDAAVPIHFEVLLPAFVLGCMLARPAGKDPHVDDAVEGHQEGPTDAVEQRVSTIVSACFMVLVGLSMPPIASMSGSPDGIAWGTVMLHVLAITVISNLGKMFPAFCYRREAKARERLALAIGMFPRGEVGAGVLVVSLSYNIGGPIVLVAVLSLAVNLLCTGLFILGVKWLLAEPAAAPAAADARA